MHLLTHNVSDYVFCSLLSLCFVSTVNAVSFIHYTRRFTCLNSIKLPYPTNFQLQFDMNLNVCGKHYIEIRTSTPLHMPN